jgi:adenylate cyclase
MVTPRQLLENWRRRRSARELASLEQLRPPSRRKRLVEVAAILVGTTALCGFLDLNAFSYLEHYAYNMRMATYTARQRSREDSVRKRIVLVTISDDTSKEVPGPTIPRECHAKVVRELTRAGAKVIAFDIIFDESRSGDAEFAAAAKAAGSVVWACCLVNELTPDESLLLPNERLRQASPYCGHVLIPIDPERPEIDRVRAVISAKEAAGSKTVLVPAFSLEVLRATLGLTGSPLRQGQGRWQFGGVTVPVDAEGYFRLAFLGKTDETQYSHEFTVIPYEDVWKERLREEFYRKGRFFQGKTVIVGNTTTVLNDHRLTPVGDMWGVEMHAHAVATLLRQALDPHGRSWTAGEAAPWANAVAIVALPALACLLAAVWRLPWALLGTTVLVAGYFAGNAWLFVERGVWLHLVAPCAATIVASLGLLTQRGLTEERAKNRATSLLKRYVSPQVATHIMENPQGYVLGGMGVVATVLFSDIRGFTSMSERLRPRQVVDRLNEYLQAMTVAVFAHGGTVGKYMGDAIMAVFGVPVPHKDHAHRAVAAALDMQTALLKLQEQWRSQGLPLIDIGIGINTGDMIVGNIGSEYRLDFTVIGDSVNLASRVEGLNKDLGTRILVTELTYESVRDEVEARGPLTASVKGKEEPVVVYEVLGRAAPVAKPAVSV